MLRQQALLSVPTRTEVGISLHIPPKIARDTQLTWFHKAVYGVLQGCNFQPTEVEIAAAVNATRRGVQKAIHSLEDRGWIHIYRNQFRAGNAYVLCECRGEPRDDRPPPIPGQLTAMEGVLWDQRWTAEAARAVLALKGTRRKRKEEARAFLAGESGHRP